MCQIKVVLYKETFLIKERFYDPFISFQGTNCSFGVDAHCQNESDISGLSNVKANNKKYLKVLCGKL